MNEQFNRKLFFTADDDWPGEDEDELCAMGEHDFEPVLMMLDGVIEVMVYECANCGAIDG